MKSSKEDTDTQSESAFVESFYTACISALLREGKIIAQDDLSTIKEVLYNEYDSMFNHVAFVFTYVDDLMKSIDLENKHKQYRQAILLATTCVEHILNEFYGTYYERAKQMSNTKINQLLKANGISEKTGGLFMVTFGQVFPEDLGNKIDCLKRERNSFAHYKMKKVFIEEWDDDTEDQTIKEIALSAPKVIKDLRSFFDEMHKNLYPEDKEAHGIFKKLEAMRKSNN